MVEDEFDEEERERRKRDSIDFRNKKRTANTFLFCMTLFEIVITILIICALFLLSALLILKPFDTNSAVVQKVFVGALFVCFFGGLFLGFLVYKMFARWIIRIMDLENKLPEDVLMHYRKQTKEEKEAELKK